MSEYVEILPDPTSADSNSYGVSYDTAERDHTGRLVGVDEATWDIDLDPWEWNITATTTTDYAYDDAGQLTGADDATTERHWAYDARGNRTSVSVDDGTAVATTTYAYDPWGRLASATGPGGATTTYGHDASGRRVSESSAGSEVTYGYDAAGMLSTQTRVEAGTETETTRTYLAGAGLSDVVETTDPEGPDPATTRTAHISTDDALTGISQVISYSSGEDWRDLMYGDGRALADWWYGQGYSYDHLGSRRAYHQGETTATAASYDPWGRTDDPAPEGADLVSFGYRGELTTGGLVHLRNRDYDPATGVFLSPDPVDGTPGTPDEANPYDYVDNDPINKIDPLGLRPDEGPCSVFNGTEIVLDTETCENALDLWEHRDRSGPDCAAVGGVTYGSGTCWVPPQSGQQKDFCFPPTSADGSVVSLGPNGQCGVWSVEIGCERFSNTVTDWICQHRVGILKVSGYALIPAAIGVGAVTGGAGAGAVLAVTSATLQVSAEAFDDSPCKSARITVAVVLTILGGGVGGAFSEGGLVAGEAVTEAGLAGLDQVEFTC